MSLRDQQIEFVLKVAELIQWAYAQGYTLSFGDAWAKSGHKEGSFHYKRLAIDLNLFLEGKYLDDTDFYRPLGAYWISIGGTWGGRWNDGNHFSWGEK